MNELAEALDRLLSGLRARLPLRPDLEITLEANPGTVERDKFAEFREIGINRLSIGVQSFDDEHLHALGRIHDRRAAVAAALARMKSLFSRLWPKESPGWKDWASNASPRW